MKMLKETFYLLLTGKEQFQTFTVWGSIDDCFPLFKIKKLKKKLKIKKPEPKDPVMSTSLATILRDMKQAEMIWSCNLTPVISFSQPSLYGRKLLFLNITLDSST